MDGPPRWLAVVASTDAMQRYSDSSIVGCVGKPWTSRITSSVWGRESSVAFIVPHMAARPVRLMPCADFGTAPDAPSRGTGRVGGCRIVHQQELSDFGAGITPQAAPSACKVFNGASGFTPIVFDSSIVPRSREPRESRPTGLGIRRSSSRSHREQVPRRRIS